MQNANKVKFGLKNIHLAKTTLADDGSATFGEVWPFPGAVDLSMEAPDDGEAFRADDKDYWIGGGTPGFSGTLEMALFPAKFKIDVLGYKRDANGVLYEPDQVEESHWALMFEFKNDKTRTRHVVHNVTFGRLGIASHTTENPVTPITETISVNSSPIYVPALDEWITQAEMDEVTDAAIYAGFFGQVYVPVAEASEGDEESEGDGE